jgi:hypothetical protein
MNNRSQERKNTVLFYLASIASFGLMAWFSLAFFRDFLGMHDVSLEMVFIGTSAIGSYAAYNRMIQHRCGELKSRPGEWIFLGVFVWGGLMWTLYQTRILYHQWGIELSVPDFYYYFLMTLVGIFTTSSIWGYFMPNGPKINPAGKQNQKEEQKKDEKIQA